jgi:hypothetical protein
MAPKGANMLRPYKYLIIDITLVGTGWLVIPKLIQI